MTGKEIRQLLNELPGVSGAWRDDCKRIVRERVDQAGGVLFEVDAWVQENGGRIEPYPLRERLPAHRGQQHVPTPLLYVVPNGALHPVER